MGTSGCLSGQMTLSSMEPDQRRILTSGWECMVPLWAVRVGEVCKRYESTLKPFEIMVECDFGRMGITDLG